jgi:hypothetical protein
MIMPKQQNGSAKRFLPYHNILILHKSKNYTVKDQLNFLKLKNHEGQLQDIVVGLLSSLR